MKNAGKMLIDSKFAPDMTACEINRPVSGGMSDIKMQGDAHDSANHIKWGWLTRYATTAWAG